MPGSRLLLIDGMPVLYRSFFAIRDLCTRAGRPTNAVFGFIRLVTQLREVWQPTHWAVVFDGGLPAERLELVPDYKAQRAPTPDALKEQIAPAQEFLERSSVAWFREDGQEADDLMASMASTARDDVDEILLATGDKDMYQLIDEQVCVVSVSGKGEAMDADAVHEKLGVAPAQVVDWLALVGDSADNIAGVSGVGPKTATRLIAEYGSLGGLWDALDTVMPLKLRESLVAARETVDRNVTVVRLKTNVGPDVNLDALRVCDADPGRLLPFYEEMEFNTLASQLRQQDLFAGM